MAPTTHMLMTTGAILALLGVVGFALPSFTIRRTADVAKIGDRSIEARELTFYRIPPSISAVALMLGLLAIGGGFYH